MSKKQILALFVCSLVPWTVGNGLVPLLPVYATQLGADPAAAGYYLAFSYFALAVGAVSAGWLSDRLQRRKMPLIVAGLAGIPIAWLIGRVGGIWGLSVLTAMLWFCGGLGLALIGILTGLSAGEDERGKIFGILSLTGGMGALIGGLATGFIVDRWGFPSTAPGWSEPPGFLWHSRTPGRLCRQCVSCPLYRIDYTLTVLEPCNKKPLWIAPPIVMERTVYSKTLAKGDSDE